MAELAEFWNDVEETLHELSEHEILFGMLINRTPCKKGSD
jgi:hypothetical protein